MYTVKVQGQQLKNIAEIYDYSQVGPSDSELNQMSKMHKNSDINLNGSECIQKVRKWADFPQKEQKKGCGSALEWRGKN